MNPGAQWRAKVLARRQSGRYMVLTVTAPRIAERCRPGHVVTAAVGGDSGLLLRRQLWIGASSASGRDGGALEIVLDTAEAGARRISETAQGSSVDLIGPVGRPFSLPREPLAATLAGAGAAAAALLWLASELGVRGSRVRFAHLPPEEPYGLLEARRLSSHTASGTDVAAVMDDALQGSDVLYSAGPGSVLAEVVSAAPGLPHQAALQTDLVCAAGTCTACVVPVTGRDGLTRMVRACTDGPVFLADLVRWEDLGSIPAECWDGGAP